MSLSRLMNQPLTVQTMGGAGVDAYGSALPAAQGAPVAVVGYLEQTSTTEFLNGRQTTVTTWQAYLPAGTAIHPMDYIDNGGQRFQVDGEPWSVYNPRTQAFSHIQVKLIEVS